MLSYEVIPNNVIVSSCFSSDITKTFEKDSENTFKFVDYWEPLDSDEIKSIEARFPEEDWKMAEDMTRYDELLSDEEDVIGTCIVVSGNSPAEIIADLYDKMCGK